MLKRPALALLICLLVVAGTVQAQLRLGVKGGISFSTFVGESEVHVPVIGEEVRIDIDQIRDGFAGGAFITLNLSRWFAIQPELLYVQKGGEASAFGVTATWKVDYFEVPILARLNIPLGGASLYLFGGPTMAFNTSSKLEVTAPLLNVSENLDIVRGNDWIATFGAGFEVPVSTVVLSFDARYSIGLTDLVDLEENLSDDIGGINIPDIWDGRNGTLLLLAGIGFDIGTASRR